MPDAVGVLAECREQGREQSWERAPKRREYRAESRDGREKRRLNTCPRCRYEPRPGWPKQVSQRPTAAIPMENPYCSCRLTRVHPQPSRMGPAGRTTRRPGLSLPVRCYSPSRLFCFSASLLLCSSPSLLLCFSPTLQLSNSPTLSLLLSFCRSLSHIRAGPPETPSLCSPQPLNPKS